MHQPTRLLLGLVLVVAMTGAVAQQFDLLTLNCLVGYENDDHPQICEMRPDLSVEATHKLLRGLQSPHAKRQMTKS